MYEKKVLLQYENVKVMTPGLLMPPRAQMGSKGPNQEKAKKAFTLHTWTQIPGKMSLFEQLAKLKNKKKAKNSSQDPSVVTSDGKSKSNCGFCLHPEPQNARVKPPSEWLNVEKSVRFTLPPDEVKRRSSSSKNASSKSSHHR